MSVDVTMLTSSNFQRDCDDLMVLCHTDMFNKYCLWSAPSISFLSEFGVFYGGTLSELLIHLHHVCFHQQNIYNALLLCIVIAWRPLFSQSQPFMYNLVRHTLTCFICDLSVCSRSWGLVSCFPACRQLPALVLYSAFLWRVAPWSHHLCRILHCQPPWQPGIAAWTCTA